MSRKTLTVSILLTLFCAPSVFAACKYCAGNWPGMTCKLATGTKRGNTKCKTSVGWCTYDTGGESCNGGGSCNPEWACEPENQASYELPKVPAGETLVLVADTPKCQGSGQTIEA